MMEWINQPWPWYITGPMIGLTVPVLLLMGNKHFGISSSLRHVCAACVPAEIPFFKYDWKKEAWNLFFVVGIVVGGWVASGYLSQPGPIQIAESTVRQLEALQIPVDAEVMPSAIFNTDNIFTLKGLVFFVLGGFLVGFGARYAGGCTSGHAIMGLSNLQWPSLISTCCFMAGGFAMVHLVFPWLFRIL